MKQITNLTLYRTKGKSLSIVPRIIREQRMLAKASNTICVIV